VSSRPAILNVNRSKNAIQCRRSMRKLMGWIVVPVLLPLH
jgi:hypothetical protein